MIVTTDQLFIRTKYFRTFFVPVYGFVKNRKLSARFEKTGMKMIACIYYDSLQHVNSNLNDLHQRSYTLFIAHKTSGFRMMVEFG